MKHAMRKLGDTSAVSRGQANAQKNFTKTADNIVGTARHIKQGFKDTMGVK